MSDEKEEWIVPKGIICMIIGCITIYSALFSTGYFIYGEISLALIFLLVTIVSGLILFKNAKKNYVVTLMNPNSIKYKNPGSSSTTRFERIHTVILDNKKSGELLVAKEIKKLIEKNNKKNKKTVLGLATGSSPKGTLKYLLIFIKMKI